MTHGAGRTDVGRVRSNNEDAILVAPAQGLYAVIDGMGGLAAGEVAAEHALQALRAVPSAAGVASRKVLVAAFEDARARILRDGEAHPERREMGAVATAVRLDDEGLGFTLAHAGDTRAWLVSAGGVRLLTVDHVEQVGEGKPRVSRDLGRRHLPAQWVDVTHVKAARGDLLVLASDGLHDAVPTDELERTFQKLRAERVAPDAAAGRLVALALLHGGPDNVSVVVVRLEGFRRAEPTRARQLAIGAALGVLCAGGGGAAAWLLGAGAPASPDGQGAPSAEAPWTADTVVETADWAPTTSMEPVAPGHRFLLRGTRLRAADWRLEVGDGAEARLVRSVIAASGAVEIRLGEGAHLVLEDLRIAAGSFRIEGPPTSTVELTHVLVETDRSGGIVGPVVKRREDVRPESLAPGSAAPQKNGAGAVSDRGAQRRVGQRGTGGGVAEGGAPPSAPASSPSPTAPPPPPTEVKSP